MKLSNQNISKILGQMNKIEALIVEANKNSIIIKEQTFEEFFKNFQHLLLKLSYLIGLDKPLDKIEIGLLANHIYDYHDNFNLNEIELAFKLNEAGKLDKKIIHFQIFTCSYLSDILNNYQSTRSKAIFQYMKLEEMENSKQIENKKNKMTNEEAYELIVELYQKEKDIPLFAPYTLAFEHLKENNIQPENWDKYKKDNQIYIKRIFDLTKEELTLEYKKLFVKQFIIQNIEI